MCTHLARQLARGACLALALVLLPVALAGADDFKTVKREVQGVLANPAATGAAKVSAIQRIGNFDGTPDCQAAVELLFTVFKTPDRTSAKFESERDQKMTRLIALSETIHANNNRATSQQIQEVNALRADITRLNDLANATSKAKNAGVDTLAGMSSRAAKQAIIGGIENRNGRISAACLAVAKRQASSQYYSAAASRLVPRPVRDGTVRAMAVQALEAIDAKRAEPVFIAALKDKLWMVRSHAVAALSRLRSLKSVDGLIDRLGQEVGRLKWDIARALKRITGKEFRDSATQWRAWWNANKDGFVPPANASSGGNAPGGNDPGGNGGGAAAQRTGSFYGIPVETTRPIFVIDRSGSMVESTNLAARGAGAPGAQPGMPVPAPAGQKSKWSVVKEELYKALGGLAKGSSYNIVWYNHEVASYKETGMVKASERELARVKAQVDPLNAKGATNIHDALETAFKLAQGLGRDGKPGGVFTDGGKKVLADTIYFLTDGMPTAGPTTNTTEILAAVKNWNAALGLRIHVICVGMAEDSAGARFLKALADAHGGTFVLRNK